MNMIADSYLDEWYHEHYKDKHAQWGEWLTDVSNWADEFDNEDLNVEGWIARAISECVTCVGNNFNWLSDAISNLHDWAEGSEDMEEMFGEGIRSAYREFNIVDNQEMNESHIDAAKKEILDAHVDLLWQAQFVLEAYRDEINDMRGYDFASEYEDKHEGNLHIVCDRCGNGLQFSTDTRILRIKTGSCGCPSK